MFDDVLIGISFDHWPSGNSQNVLKVVQFVQKWKEFSCSLRGHYKIPTKNYGFIQINVLSISSLPTYHSLNQFVLMNDVTAAELSNQNLWTIYYRVLSYSFKIYNEQEQKTQQRFDLNVKITDFMKKRRKHGMRYKAG